MKLPRPRSEGKTSLEQCLQQRESIRSYVTTPLTLEEVAQLLWSAQGASGSGGARTAPSAGALYPLELYVVSGAVTGLPAGIYRYAPETHQLDKRMDGDLRAELAAAALGQRSVTQAPATFAFTAVFGRITPRYGERGIRYTFLEAGHAAQNLCLQAVALGLGTVCVGAFHDEEVSKVLRLSPNEQPLYLIPAGRMR